MSCAPSPSRCTWRRGRRVSSFGFGLRPTASRSSVRHAVRNANSRDRGSLRRYCPRSCRSFWLRTARAWTSIGEIVHAHSLSAALARGSDASARLRTRNGCAISQHAIRLGGAHRRSPGFSRQPGRRPPTHRDDDRRQPAECAQSSSARRSPTSRPEGGPACKTYATFDGGYSWSDATFADLQAYGAGDPQVAFTPNGTAIFSCLAFIKDNARRTRAALYVIAPRTADERGEARRSRLLVRSPMIAVDRTVGRFAGRIYMSTLYGREYNLGLFRSSDDGRTSTGR